MQFLPTWSIVHGHQRLSFPNFSHAPSKGRTCVVSHREFANNGLDRLVVYSSTFVKNGGNDWDYCEIAVCVCDSCRANVSCCVALIHGPLAELRHSEYTPLRSYCSLVCVTVLPTAHCEWLEYIVINNRDGFNGKFCRVTDIATWECSLLLCCTSLFITVGHWHLSFLILFVYILYKYNYVFNTAT